MARNTLPSITAGEAGLNRYLDEIRKFPMLEPQQEYMLAKRYAEHGDRDAAHKLVTSHLRLVAKVAKNDITHRHLADQFADHGRTGPLERAYMAVVWGRPAGLKGTIDAPLGRSGSDRTKRAVQREDSHDAREAITHYQVMERFQEQPDATALASLIECRLETGRTHQIRVHMAHVGNPLIGDQDYAAGFKTKANRLPEPAKTVVNRFPRQALHAFLLAFEHPRTGEVMEFEAPMPDDMQELVEALRA